MRKDHINPDGKPFQDFIDMSDFVNKLRNEHTSEKYYSSRVIDGALIRRDDLATSTETYFKRVLHVQFFIR